MSTPLIAGLLLEGRVWCSNGKQDSVTTFHWQVQAITGGAPTDTDFLTAVEGTYYPFFQELINNESNYLGVTMQIITPPIGLLRLNNDHAGVGTGGAGALPTQSSGLVRWGTNLGGRAYRGRNFWPFPPSAFNGTNGAPISDYLTALQTAANEYVSHSTWTLGGGSATINPVLRHRKNKAGLTPAPTVIISAEVVGEWATQRRRGALGRPNTSPFTP